MTEMRTYQVKLIASPRSTTARSLDDVIAGVEFAFNHSNWACVITVVDGQSLVAWKFNTEKKAPSLVQDAAAAGFTAACSACGEVGCAVWLNYLEVKSSARSRPSSDVEDANSRLEKHRKEVIEEKKPRLRDRLNPLYYIRKELRKMSETFKEATDRIEQKVNALNTAVEELKANIAAESEQFVKVAEELRGMATNDNLTAAQSATLSGLADKIGASATSIQESANNVKGIVPDAPAKPPISVSAVALKIEPPTQDVVAGTAFEVKVVALDAQGDPAQGYTGTLHFSSSPANVGDVLPGDHVFGTDKNPAVLFAAPGTYVLSVTDAGNPGIAPGQLTVMVAEGNTAGTSGSN